MKILELLKEAKKLYLKETRNGSPTLWPGMCWCIKIVIIRNIPKYDYKNLKYSKIKKQIPEFNPEYLESKVMELINKHPAFEVDYLFWWDNEDRLSRIQAFDKLIKAYERSDKEFV